MQNYFIGIVGQYLCDHSQKKKILLKIKIRFLENHFTPSGFRENINLDSRIRFISGFRIQDSIFQLLQA